MKKNIYIAIPTYNRQDMLKELLIKTLHCIQKVKTKFDIKIIVIDNDINCSSKNIIENFNSNNLIYFVEKNKGYSSVRNRCLFEARKLGAHYLLFIDDDEYPHEEWLNCHINMIEEGYDIVFGSVFPVFFDYDVPPWVQKNKLFIKNKVAINKSPVYYTSNTLINLDKTRNIVFDHNFNKYGGEDVTYFKKIEKITDCKIGYAMNAIVYEHIPKERLTYKWFLKRAYYGGISDVLTDKSENNYMIIIYKLIKNFLIGLICLPILPFKDKFFRIKVISKFFRFLGSLKSLLFIKYEE